MIRYLLDTRVISEEELEDNSVVRQKIEDNLPHLLTLVNVITVYRESFLKTANDLIDKDVPEVLVVLIATAVEHSIDMFYRELLFLEEQVITEIVGKNSIGDKLGWLFQISTNYEHEFPDDLRREVISVFELRNSVVHFKALGEPLDDEGPQTLYRRLEALNIKRLLQLGEVVHQTLEAVLEDMLPSHRLSKSLFQAISEPDR